MKINLKSFFNLLSMELFLGNSLSNYNNYISNENKIEI